MDKGFENCDTITSLSLSSSLTQIGRHSFTNCSKLTSLNVPPNVNFIGAFAFYGTGLTSATLPTPENWSAGADSFSYIYFNLSSYSSDNYDYVRYIDFDESYLTNVTNFAPALTKPVSIEIAKDRSGNLIYDTYSALKHWYSQDWVKTTP